MALTVNTNIINDTNQYLLDAKNVKGTFVVVASTAERDALPAATTVNGSLCYCTADSKFYQYNGSSWQEKEFGTNTTNDAYNLGYYDTIAENADGSYTITRQTGFRNISIDLFKNGEYRTTQNGHGEYGADTGIHNLPIVSGSKNFINNLLTVRDNSEVYAGSTGISISENGMCWVNLGDDYTTTEQYREYFAKNNIYAQYKLATATTEKVEPNHYARYNERFILEHNKSEAERSANLLHIDDVGSKTINGITYSIKDGVITLNGTATDNVLIKALCDIKANQSYYLKIFDSPIKLRCYYSNDVNTPFGTLVMQAKEKLFTPTTDVKCLNIWIWKDDTINSNIKPMLVEGSTSPITYQPYNQNKHITNNEALFLKTESDRSANVFDINTVTIGNGYDYTATASDWVKAIDIPVEPKTTYTASSIIGKYAFNHGNIVADYNKNTITTGSDTTTLSLFMYVGDYSGTVNAWFSNYMLNEGTEPLPYQSYEGKVIHEKDLKNASTNLGHYDTITENPDGTYTITRQTGYINGTDFSNWYMNAAGNRYVIFEHIKVNKNIENIIGNCSRVGHNSWWQSTFTQVTISYDENNDSLVILLPYGTAENDSSPLNDIRVQYKLPNARTEKVEANHYARYNERFILEHNKSEANKSANVLNTFDRSNIPSNSSLYTASLNSDGSYTSTASDDSRAWVYANSDFKLHLTKGIYSFSVTGTLSDNPNTQMQIFDSNSNTLCTLFRAENFKKSFTLTSDADIGIMIKLYDSADLKIMLNEGYEPLPYQPYSGEPIHKKEFEDFKNSMKFIPYVSCVETSSSENILENGTYFVIPTDPFNASLKLEVKAATHGTLQTAYFSGGIISVNRLCDSKLKRCIVQITYGAGSSADSTYISDRYSPAISTSGMISRVTGKCKIYKL